MGVLNLFRNFSNRGQVTIFVITGIGIVVLGILSYFFIPQVKDIVSGELEPNNFIRDNLESEVLSATELLSPQGGYIKPEGSVLYNDKNVKYLCYNAKYLQRCIVQQPMIKEHYEKEMEKLLENKTLETITKLRNEYERRGYKVSILGDSSVDVKIELGKIVVYVDAPMTISRDGSDTFKTFSFEKNSRLYTLLITATSIIDFESTLGDTETTLYIKNYPDLTIDKLVLGDGTTIYTVGDVTTDEKFTFASRSLAWPPGYGTEK